MVRSSASSRSSRSAVRIVVDVTADDRIVADLVAADLAIADFAVAGFTVADLAADLATADLGVADVVIVNISTRAVGGGPAHEDSCPVSVAQTSQHERQIPRP
jgi:hypothetical protein